MPRVRIGEDVLRQGYALQHLPKCQILGQHLVVRQCPMHVRMPVIIVNFASLCLEDSKRPSQISKDPGEGTEVYQACESLQTTDILLISAGRKGGTEPSTG